MLPSATVEFAGVTTIELRVPLPTVKVVVPLTPEALAVMVTEPFFLPRAIPDPRTWAIFGLDDFQVSPLNKELVLPSLNSPVAVNLISVPLLMRGLLGLIVIATK